MTSVNDVRNDLNTDQEHKRTNVDMTFGEQFICGICYKSFSRDKHLLLHLRTHTGDTLINCDICCKEFNKMFNLKVHMRTHTGYKPYKCDICCKCFNQRRNLNDHMKIHTGEELFQCKVCGKSFIERRHLKTHKIKCNMCNKSFTLPTTKNILRDYLKKLTRNGPDKFDVNNIMANVRNDINTDQEHTSTNYTGNKQYICGVCNKSFSQDTDLLLHMRIHVPISDESYKCEMCLEQFNSINNLNNHMRTHKYHLSDEGFTASKNILLAYMGRKRNGVIKHDKLEVHKEVVTE